MDRRCLHCWQQVTRIIRVTGEMPEDEWLELAQKARFSQHTMTDGEFDVLLRAAQTRTEKLKSSASVPRRLWHRYGPVLY